LEHARRTNQIVVTSNHDMILLCVEKARASSGLIPGVGSSAGQKSSHMVQRG
jgi:hypothetical protein